MFNVARGGSFITFSVNRCTPVYLQGSLTSVTFINGFSRTRNSLDQHLILEAEDDESPVRTSSFT